MAHWLDQNKGLIFGILIAGAILVGIFVYTQPTAPDSALVLVAPTATFTSTATSTPTPLPSYTPSPTPANTPTPKPLRVYISGEVQQPDVYLLPPGSIIKDVILLAGGATAQADLQVVNLSLEIKDQQQINIPSQAQNLPTPPIISGGVEPTAAPAINSPAADISTPVQPSEIQNLPPTKINLNTADVSLLDELPGVGPAIAQRIIDYREANGPFVTIESIMEVSGIGPKTFERMKGRLTVE